MPVRSRHFLGFTFSPKNMGYLLGTLLLLCISTLYGQMTNSTYEVEIEKNMAKEHPAYYNGLKKILQDFETHLIEQQVITKNNPDNYINLLMRIAEGNYTSLPITYQFSDSLSHLAKIYHMDAYSNGISTDELQFFNAKESKIFALGQRAATYGKTNHNETLSRSDYAKIMLGLFDPKDYELAYIKLILFRFLDPHSDVVFSISIGKPTGH